MESRFSIDFESKLELILARELINIEQPKTSVFG
jgi:hypothetical protein